MSFQALFYPKSVAVIGASTRKGSVGNEIVENIATQGYKGTLFLINPKGGTLFKKKLLTSLEEIKSEIDLAIIAIPAEAVIEEVKKLAGMGVKAIIIISAGFKEAGNQELETEIADICRQYDITLIGPNCLGILNPEINLNASFAPLMPDLGAIAFISQSGAICASVLDHAKREKIGFSKFVSVGNKALIGENEILEYLYHDKQTRVIALYVEELDQIKKLRETVSTITHGNMHKPIIVLKSGKTEQGKQAALSHTGSLGGSDQGYDALFAQTGMIRADTIDELFDFIECFSRNKPLKDDDVAVITNAGGPGVLTADALVQSGLQLAQLTQETQATLRSFLPESASVSNPVDVLGDAPAQRYAQALQVVLADPTVDAVEVILTPQSMTEVEATAQAIVTLKKKSDKPIVVSFMGESLVEKGVDILNKNQIATTAFPEMAAKTLGALWDFNQWLSPRRSDVPQFKDVKKDVVRKIIVQRLGREQKLLPMTDTFAILAAYGLPMVERWVIDDIAKMQEIITHLAQKNYQTCVLKIVSDDISHKSDVGGVLVDIELADLPTAYESLIEHIEQVQPTAKIKGVEVMPMISDEGVEIILGATTDARLGKQIVVGLGGIYTEVLQDLSWGLAPLSSADIERMIAHLKIAKILSGIRGKPPLALDKLEECLARLSQLVTDFPSIAEVDVNPLKVLAADRGALVLDARIVLA